MPSLLRDVGDRLPPPVLDADDGDYAAQVYQNQQSAAINQAGTITFNSIDFTGSDLTSIATRLHDQLQGLQGGTNNEFYHLTQSQYNALSGLVNPIQFTIAGNGGLLFGTGVSVVRVSAGLYTVTLATSKSSINYNVQVTCNYTAALVPNILNQTATGFQINTLSLSGTATDPTKFYVTVS